MFDVFDGDIDEILATAKKILAVLQAKQPGTTQLVVTQPAPGATNQTVDLSPLIAAVLSLKAPPAIVLATSGLGGVVANSGLLTGPYAVSTAGTVFVSAAIAAGSASAALQISHDGGNKWKNLNGSGGGSLTAGDQYTFIDYFVPGESLNVSASAVTTFDVLNVIFFRGMKA